MRHLSGWLRLEAMPPDQQPISKLRAKRIRDGKSSTGNRVRLGVRQRMPEHVTLNELTNKRS